MARPIAAFLAAPQPLSPNALVVVEHEIARRSTEHGWWAEWRARINYHGECLTASLDRTSSWLIERERQQFWDDAFVTAWSSMTLGDAVRWSLIRGDPDASAALRDAVNEALETLTLEAVSGDNE